MKRWEHGVQSAGVGAVARVTVTPSFMNRRLTVQVSRVEDDRFVDLDYEGARGFVTRWAFEPDGEGTAIEITTYVAAPPWPFRELYHLQVKPAWEACQAEAIARLQTRLSSAD